MALVARTSAVAAALIGGLTLSAGWEVRVDAKVPPARDGNIAIRQELDAARRARTLAAYDLFIARHPGHPLVEIARAERLRLAKRLRRPR